MVDGQMKPPFEDGQKVLCIADAPDIDVDGSVIASCRCVAGRVNVVACTVWSSKFGWMIATEPCFDGACHELHAASSFVPYDENSYELAKSLRESRGE